VAAVGKLVCNLRIGLDKLDPNQLSDEEQRDRASLPGHLI
jgi:hypothetical protein